MRRRLQLALALAGLLILLGGGLALYVLRSESLRERIRTRIVTELERATGGKAELSRFDFDWTSWRVTIEGLVLHGKEPQDRRPLVSVPRAELSLTVKSWFSRDVDLRALVIDRPEVHIYTDADGSTNIPSPPRKGESDPVGNLLKLKIKRLDVRNGVFEYDSRAIPLTILASGLEAQLDWEQLPQYRTALRIASLRLPWIEEASLETSLLLRPQEIVFEPVRLRREETAIEATGRLKDFRAPRVELDYRGDIRLLDIPRMPLAGGRASTQGRFILDSAEGWRAVGSVEGRDLEYRSKEYRLSGAKLSSGYTLTGNRLEMTGLRLDALGGWWEGRGVLDAWSSFQLDGNAGGLEVDRLYALVSKDVLPWSGIIQGPVQLRGLIHSRGISGLQLAAKVDVREEEGMVPLTGHADVRWTQHTGKVEFGTSHLQAGGTRMNFMGILGERMETGMLTSEPEDLIPLLRVLLKDPEFEMPLDLVQGTAAIQASVVGELEAPVVRGSAQVRNGIYRGVKFDSLETGFAISSQSIALERLQARRGQTAVAGDVTLPLSGGGIAADRPMQARLTLRNADLDEFEQLTGQSLPVKTTFDAELEALGSLDEPAAALKFATRKIELAGEVFERSSGQFRVTSNGGTQLTGTMRLGPAEFTLGGAYRHARGDWRNGNGVISVKENGLDLTLLQVVREAREGLSGIVSLEGSASFSVQKGRARLDRISAVASSGQLSLYKRPLGAFRLDANTQGEAIGLSLSLGLRQQRITASGLVQLDRDYSSEGIVRIPRLPFSLVKELVEKREGETPAPPLPVQGFVEGQAVWRAPLGDLKRGSATFTLTRLQMRPRDEALAETQVDSGELVVRNSGPVVFEVNSKGMRVTKARLLAKNTSLDLTGQYLFGAAVPWDFQLKGGGNLAVLSTFYPDLIASGTANIDARLRGVEDEPVLSGRMAIQEGSFFLRDVPNGIENAEGLILFERNRANIQRLTGRTGGGKFQVSGFIGFNEGVSTYRLQAQAFDVRVRYPEGVSTTLDADLALTGSSTRSLLSGTVTVERAGFSTQSDFAGIVGSAASPVTNPVVQNEFLRNLLFDIRIRTGPNATLQSSYTQDLQAEADLRLRGSPAKPVVLGSVKASQGDINFFGNRYTVSRGEVLFYNVAAIQPSIDLNLETRIRGVTVFISVTGPLSRLNVSYRSEPPLLSQDIFALLTVGRAPGGTTTTAPASDPTRAGQGFMAGTGNSLLGGALSGALNSRVEKFFGRSRIKIDPQMVGVENVPQARLTIEQSISRDVTLTLVTNLSRAQQQIVRLEWDLSREWQMIVVRDENGVFGADFLYRKRFK